MSDDQVKRQKASDFHPEVLRLFDKYVHGQIDRRGFLDGASRFAVGGVTAVGLLEALSPQFAWAQQVQPGDARIRTEWVEFSSTGYGKVRGLLARPATATAKLPAVLVVHENRGLNPYIEDVARRLAVEGYMALAPDALFPLGGYPGDEDKARTAFTQLDQAKTRADFVAASQWLAAHAQSSGKLGVVGFCYGGGMANFLATQLSNVAAAVPFYGNAPTAEQAAAIKAEMLIHFAETDERINAAWPAYEAALKAAGVSYTAHTYPGTQHGFHNDTTPRFDDAAAKLAWQRTLALFARRLKA
jgi:carboxymethylenebutenolidase